MTIVVGTDEAGYGPNLGPLVVAATAWRVAVPPEEAERVLDRAATDAAAAAGAVDGARGPLWADSKAVHRGAAGGGLARGVAIGLALAARQGGAGTTADGPPADVAALAARIGGIVPRVGCLGMWAPLAATPAIFGKGLPGAEGVLTGERSEHYFQPVKHRTELGWCRKTWCNFCKNDDVDMDRAQRLPFGIRIEGVHAVGH
jgi:hypothetical protein